jgi:hypothetical protein
VGRATDRRTNIDSWTSLHRRYYRRPAFILRSGQSGLRPILGILALLAALHLTERGATAADVFSTWIDGNGNWSVPTNWDSGVPDNAGGDSFTANVNNGSTVTLDTSPVVTNLFLDFFATPASTLVLGAGQSLGVTTSVVNGNVITANSPGAVGTLGIGVGGTAFNIGTLQASGGGTLTLAGPGPQ